MNINSKFLKYTSRESISFGTTASSPEGYKQTLNFEQLTILDFERLSLCTSEASNNRSQGHSLFCYLGMRMEEIIFVLMKIRDDNLTRNGNL